MVKTNTIRKARVPKRINELIKKIREAENAIKEQKKNLRKMEKELAAECASAEKIDRSVCPHPPEARERTGGGAYFCLLCDSPVDYD